MPELIFLSSCNSWFSIRARLDWCEIFGPLYFGWETLTAFSINLWPPQRKLLPKEFTLIHLPWIFAGLRTEKKSQWLEINSLSILIFLYACWAVCTVCKALMINTIIHTLMQNVSKKHDFSSFCFSRWLLPMSKSSFIILKMAYYCFVKLGKELYLWYILQILDSEILYIQNYLCQIKTNEVQIVYM